MIFHQTPIHGCWFIDLEPKRDERGFFGRAFCRREFEAHGLNSHLEQCAISFNAKRGTLRGMHWQVSPHEEAKLVRCTRGAMHDVILDLRPHSSTFLQSIGADLSAENRRMLYVAEGVAHGFMTLEDHTEIFYQMSAAHDPASARGARWNDPAFDIRWPLEPLVISLKDRTFPLFQLETVRHIST